MIQAILNSTILKSNYLTLISTNILNKSNHSKIIYCFQYNDLGFLKIINTSNVNNIFNKTLILIIFTNENNILTLNNTIIDNIFVTIYQITNIEKNNQNSDNMFYIILIIVGIIILLMVLIAFVIHTLWNKLSITPQKYIRKFA